MPSVTEALFAAANHPRVAASAVLCGLVATAAGAAAIAAMAMTNLSDGQVSRVSLLTGTACHMAMLMSFPTWSE